ncbi:hypothetical protein BU197_25145 [Streptomyces sp. CBMA291]|nr:hypothetical protein [Streptomyces sp. CBMA291]MBD0716537.1 hypothetical protein [Streptomyces sp. CBMA370]
MAGPGEEGPTAVVSPSGSISSVGFQAYEREESSSRRSRAIGSGAVTPCGDISRDEGRPFR